MLTSIDQSIFAENEVNDFLYSDTSPNYESKVVCLYEI